MSKIKVEFSYLRKVTTRSEIFTPYIWLEIKTKIGVWRNQKFLFDTGADYTSFPNFVATVLGIDLKSCPQEIMYTANNEPMMTFYSKISVSLSGKMFELPCVFTDKDDTPFLLGRVGFIERFNMTLNAQERKLVFEEL